MIDAVEFPGQDPLRVVRSRQESGESAARRIETDPSEPVGLTAIQPSRAVFPSPGQTD